MLSPTASNIRDASALPVLSLDTAPSTPVQKPVRPHHMLHRSISELSPPMLYRSRERETEHHHHRPHLHRHKDRAELPALDTKGENVMVQAGDSRDQSRRPSLSNGMEDGGDARASMLGVPRQRREVGPDEVKKEKERSLLRAMELKKSLMDMTELSNHTTRRLDNTYYSVLEKLANLNGTIQSLKELAIMSRKLKGDFEEEAQEIMVELGGQLDGFEDFNQQSQKIEGLESRIKKGRERVSGLSKRVEMVKDKIMVWESLEGEWQSKMRYRMKVAWAFFTVIFLIGLGLALYQYTPANDKVTKPGTLRGFDVNNISIEISEAKEVLLNETLHLKRKTSDALQSLRQPPEQALDDNPVLRAFDEL